MLVNSGEIYYIPGKNNTYIHRGKKNTSWGIMETRGRMLQYNHGKEFWIRNWSLRSQLPSQQDPKHSRLSTTSPYLNLYVAATPSQRRRPARAGRPCWAMRHGKRCLNVHVPTNSAGGVIEISRSFFHKGGNKL
jgi:hypothetical protein